MVTDLVRDSDASLGHSLACTKCGLSHSRCFTGGSGWQPPTDSDDDPEEVGLGCALLCLLSSLVIALTKHLALHVAVITATPREREICASIKTAFERRISKPGSEKA